MTTTTVQARRGHVLTDSVTMTNRNLLHMVRYPGLTFFVVIMPVVFLLLFVYVLGGSIGAGIAGSGVDARAAYVAYVVPGILLMTIGGSAGGTATTVSMDMTEGIVARFRTMAISRAAVLTGHVIGNTLQALIAVVVVLCVGLLIGFRPTADAAQWLATAGLMTLVAFAITWVAVAMGMAAKSVETASNLPMVLIFLPFLGSGFVPIDSMPGWLQWFAEFQPFTPWVETVRGLLTGSSMGWNPMLAIAWTVVLAVVGYAWSMAIYERKSVR